jgi:DNA polymerase elongation subunit (family B)
VQRARAKAPVVIPLNLEPESKFYTDPIIVLDFQSLYPSIMIAYNYCYSTCLGTKFHWVFLVFDKNLHIVLSAATMSERTVVLHGFQKLWMSV